MSASTSAAAPATLRDAGTSQWEEITSRYALRPDELTVLASACKAIDRLDLVERAWADLGMPMMSTGSMGQEVTHPLLAEQQKLEAHLAGLLARLKLPDTLAAVNPSSGARKAADARWSRGA